MSSLALAGQRQSNVRGLASHARPLPCEVLVLLPDSSQNLPDAQSATQPDLPPHLAPLTIPFHLAPYA